METIFGVEWDALTITAVRRFLSAAGHEPLTWEAKADGKDPLHPATVRKAICAFANSDLGGFLIIGAAESGTGWALPGLQHPKRDIAAWIGNIAREVHPTPAVDIRTFRRAAGRGPVAIVWVPAVPEPPAMTNDGIVYQRVSGSSVAVTDGRVLASLFSKGDAARKWAEEVAERAVSNALDVEGRPLDAVWATFGFGATGGPADRSSVLFTAAMISTIEQEAPKLDASGDAIHPSRWLKHAITATLQQETVEVRLELIDGRVIELTVGWDGSVGIAFAFRERADRPLWQLAITDTVRRAWTVAIEILKAYGAAGSVHMAIAMWDKTPTDVVTVARWTAVGPPSDVELASVKRELQRAMGDRVLEG